MPPQNLVLLIKLIYISGLCQDDGQESLMESAIVVEEVPENETAETASSEEIPKESTGADVCDSIQPIVNESDASEDKLDADVEGATGVVAAVSEEGSNPDFEIVENESFQNLSVDSETSSVKTDIFSEYGNKTASSEPEVEQSMKLPDTVTHLVSRSGVNVYIVGTAHFSHESQEDVAKVRFNS